MSDSTLPDETPLMLAIAARVGFNLEDREIIKAKENLASHSLTPSQVPLIRALFTTSIEVDEAEASPTKPATDSTDETHRLVPALFTEYMMAYTLPKRLKANREPGFNQRELSTLSQCAMRYSMFASQYGLTLKNTWVEDLFWTLNEFDSPITRENKVSLGLYLVEEAMASADYLRGLKYMCAYSQHIAFCSDSTIREAGRTSGNFYSTLTSHRFEHPDQIKPIYDELKTIHYSKLLEGLDTSRFISRAFVIEQRKAHLDELFNKPDPRLAKTEVETSTAQASGENTVFQESFIEMLERNEDRYWLMNSTVSLLASEKLPIPALIKDLREKMIDARVHHVKAALGKKGKRSLKEAKLPARIFKALLAKAEAAQKLKQAQAEAPTPPGK